MFDSNCQRKWPTENGLRVGHLNINSAVNKIHEVQAFLDNSGTPFHVFGLSEARISDQVPVNDVAISGYNIELRHPQRKLETGIAVYTHTSINAKRLKHLEQYNVESIWLEIKFKKTAPLLVGFIYRNPDERIDWDDRFTSMIDAVHLESTEYILLGDFNKDLLKPNKPWLDKVDLCNLKQIVNIPTRVTSKTKTLIDHIYVDNLKHISEVCVPPIGCSDHFAVCLTWTKKGIKIPKTNHKTVTYRSFKLFNDSSFLQELSKANLNNVYNITDPDEAVTYWHAEFLKVYNKHAPVCTKRVKHNTKPEWLDVELQQAIENRDLLKKQGKEEEYKRQRNAVNTLKRQKMKAYFSKLVEDKQNTKKIWKAINQITNKHKQPQPTINISPNTLNEHFTSVAEKVIQTDYSNENDLQKLKDFCESKQVTDELKIPLMSVHEVYNALTHLRQTSSRGLDGIDNKILKLAAPLITETLTYVYNLCIQKSSFPLLFKQAKVIPLHKAGDTNDPSNYRPISILSSLSKPVEKHIQNHIQAHLLNHNLLHENQSGFRPNHSCHTALTSLVEDWLSHINNNKLSAALFVDFAKAFDVIDHNLLIRKLQCYKLSSDCIKLLTSFLCERTQSVCLNQEKSDPLGIKFGVPQGSILGPLLFSVYINDLPLHISEPCEMFADDTTIHTSNDNTTELASSLQKSADELQNWTELNHMALNPNKTETIMITTRQKRQNLTDSLPPIYICNQPIREVQEHKLLGITIDNNLSWNQHIANLSKNISKKTYQLSRIKHFLNEHTRKLYYTAHIQSSIDYASTLWDSASGNIKKPLISVQRRAVKNVLLKNKLHSNDFASLHILPLKERLEFNKCVLIHKILQGKSSPRLSNLFARNLSRNNKKLNTPIPRIDLYKSSLKYSGSILWNKLPLAIQQAKSNQTFKTHLMKHYLQHLYS